MAIPRVFLSSTCYDLANVRDTVRGFIETFGLEPCLSDHGDVFYHPDLHTHESCVNEIGNCDLFILVIGGKFGGTYVSDPKKSIVNAEYAAARELNIPVFTFVKRDVLDDHRLYQKNKNNQIITQIDFPSIDHREDAKEIFQFIDDVRQARVNNGFFPFEYSKDIEFHLRKQWAGMFYSLLQQRKISEDYNEQRTLLSDMKAATEQLGLLMKNMYRQLDKTNANTVITNAEERTVAEKFFRDIFDYFRIPGFISTSLDTLLSLVGRKEWFNFLAATHDFEFVSPYYALEHGEKRKTKALGCIKTHLGIIIEPEDRPDFVKKLAEFEKGFAAFNNLSAIHQKELLEKFVISS
ncbi:DUF4062 domain-containing protein [Nitrosomonas sp.]|uniref:DUF4062 domain-containing protein n=2 Tax=Nitrosomonas sp. TaxID=42353 RepID=UPI0027313DCC|nr:DUF4062 domain-containing protein [Nitrosomonas sp.]MDP2225493.1 DUF4062 domain-containing protein [Nitrosomonas sp.]